jgi:glutamine synthetase
MLGSSASIAGANFVLNTIVADILQKFAERLEAANDFTNEVGALISDTVKEHKRIIFNGNNYSEEWVAEAESRGLLNLKSTVECIPTFIKDKNVAVFVKHGVLSKSEIESRYEILIENYVKTINIEALTMISMAKTEILPAAFRFSKELSDTINSVKATGMSVEVSAQSSVLKELSPVLSSFASNINSLKKAVEKASNEASSNLKQAETYFKIVVPAMEALRVDADKLECIIPRDLYPFPTYSELLFNV